MSSTTATTPALPVEQDERKKRAAWRPLAAAAIAGSVLVTTGFGVWASLSASATNVLPQSVETGTLKLEMTRNGVGVEQAITKLAPTDTVHRFVTLTNSGTIDGKDLTFAVAATGVRGNSALLTGTTDKALRVTITACATAWVVDATANTGTCANNATTTVLASTAVGALPANATTGAGTLLTGGESFTAGTAKHLRITVALPDQDEHTVNGSLSPTTIQDASANLTYTFREVQRTALTTNS